MKNPITATVVDGVLQLDEPLQLPNHSRVQITVLPLDFDPVAAAAAWESMKRRIQEHPIHTGGERFTRDDLHERHS